LSERSCKPAVSIVIPTYNHAPLLQIALESVRAQTVQDWEAIVVNNYSNDDTIDVVARFEDPRIRLVNFRNNGIIAASRNEGVRHAKADIIAFLDSDDIWYPSKLERCFPVLRPGIVLVCHGELWTRNGAPYLHMIYGPREKADYRELLLTGNCLSTSAILLRKSAFEQAGGFSEAPEIVTAEDYDLWLTLARNGGRFEFLNELLGEYRLHGSNETRSVHRHLDAVLAVLNRHFSDRQSHGILFWIRKRYRYSRLYADAANRSLHTGGYVDTLRYGFRSMMSFPLIPFMIVPAGFKFVSQRMKAGT